MFKGLPLPKLQKREETGRRAGNSSRSEVQADGVACRVRSGQILSRPLRNDGGLHVAVVAHQVAHHTQQVREWLGAVDEVAGRNLSAGN